MKYLIVIIIKFYWLTIPNNKRRKCLFKKSCSHFVFDETMTNGFISGIKVFVYRVDVCNSSSKYFINPITGKLNLLTRSGEVIDHQQISDL